LRTAALQLLAEIGYDGLTMDAVADRAHAGKGAIYRRWRSKAELIVDALGHAKPPVDDIDTGSLPGDLRLLAARMSDPDNVLDMQVIIGLVSALPRDAELRVAFREQLIAPRMAALRELFERAVVRGEIPALQHPDVLVSLLPAVLVQQTLLFGEVPKVGFAELIVDHVLLPLVSASPAYRPLAVVCSEVVSPEPVSCESEGSHVD
jgi:AcrR family transcriptional regulator